MVWSLVNLSHAIWVDEDPIFDTVGQSGAGIPVIFQGPDGFLLIHGGTTYTELTIMTRSGKQGSILSFQKGSLLPTVTILMSVGLNVEIREEGNEGDTVDNDEAIQDEWEVTSGRHTDDQVDNDHTKLDL